MKTAELVSPTHPDPVPEWPAVHWSHMVRKGRIADVLTTVHNGHEYRVHGETKTAALAKLEEVFLHAPPPDLLSRDTAIAAAVLDNAGTASVARRYGLSQNRVIQIVHERCEETHHDRYHELGTSLRAIRAHSAEFIAALQSA